MSVSRITIRATNTAKTFSSTTRSTPATAMVALISLNRTPSTIRVAAPTPQTSASRRDEWKNAVYAATIANTFDPSRPNTGFGWMRHAAAMHDDPTTTHTCDCSRLGHRVRSHRAAIARQHTVIDTEMSVSAPPYRPFGSASENVGMRPVVAMNAALSRQVNACTWRAARNAVSQ